MATIDPSIALQVRGVTDPLESYGKALSLKSLANQQRMQEAQFAKYEEDQASERKLNDLYRGNIGSDGQVNRQGVLTGAASAGLGSRIPGLQKGFAEADKATADARHQGAQTSEVEWKLNKQRLEAANGAMASLLSRPQISHDDVIGAVNGLVNQGLLAPDQGAQMVRMLPGDPVRLREFLMSKAIETADASKRLDSLMPKFQQIDGGNRVITGTVNPMTGQFTEQGAPIVKAPEGFVVGEDGDVNPTPGFARFKISTAKAGAPSVNIKTDIKTGESLAAQVGPMMKDSSVGAEAAVKQVDAAQRIIEAVDTNKLFTGPGAGLKLKAAQVGDMLGITGKDEAEKVANTRSAIRGLAELTLQGRQQMKGQGAITESEGQLAQKAMSGDVSDLTAAEIKQLAQASERAARFNYAQHERRMSKVRERPEFSGVADFYEAPPLPAPRAQPASAPVTPSTVPAWNAVYQSQAQAVQDARSAIQRGADKAAVVQRLEAAGITNHGIR